MNGLQVRLPPDVVVKIDKYLEALRPLASSRGDVVRMLTALSTPAELRSISMDAVKEQIDQIVANARIQTQRDFPGGPILYVAHADGQLQMPGAAPVHVLNFGMGRTEDKARHDLRLNITGDAQ